MDIIAHGFINTIIYSALGVIILVGTFMMIDVITKKHDLWKEIVEKQNTALAILMGSLTLGIAMIIAAAVHG